MSSRLFWRAALVEAVLVGGTFLLILLLPFGGNPLTDWGVVVGPLVWIVGSLATGRILRLPMPLTIVSAVVGGLAGALVGVAVEHYGALPIAVGVFAASCAGYEAPADQRMRTADASPARSDASRQALSASLDDAA